MNICIIKVINKINKYLITFGACNTKLQPGWGHIERNCSKFAVAQTQGSDDTSRSKLSTSSAAVNEQVLSSSNNEAMIVSQALPATSRENLIVDSGATCHMCNNESFFSELHPLSRPQKVIGGDRHVLEATAEGTVTIEMLLPDGGTKRCKLQDVLYVPNLSHNLVSVSKASEARKSLQSSTNLGVTS